VLAMASTGQGLLGKLPLDDADKPGGRYGDKKLGSALTSNRIEKHLWPAASTPPSGLSGPSVG